jgi:hypothetical protein
MITAVHIAGRARRLSHVLNSKCHFELHNLRVIGLENEHATLTNTRKILSPFSFRVQAPHKAPSLSDRQNQKQVMVLQLVLESGF